MSPLSVPFIFGFGFSTNELNQVRLIRNSLKMCCVAVPPGTGLGNTVLTNLKKNPLLPNMEILPYYIAGKNCK